MYLRITCYLVIGQADFYSWSLWCWFRAVTACTASNVIHEQVTPLHVAEQALALPNQYHIQLTWRVAACGLTQLPALPTRSLSLQASKLARQATL